MRKLLTCALMLGIPSIANAQESVPSADEDEPVVIEKWECREWLEDRARVLVTLWWSVGMSPGETGYGWVTFSAASFPAISNLDGLSMRWNWGPDEDGTWDYSFVIEPDGTGKYVDFSGASRGEKVSADSIYTCEAAERRKVSDADWGAWAAWYLPLLFGGDE